MANRFTQKAYQALKNELFILVTFVEGRRVLTHSGLPLDSLVRELVAHRGVTSLVFKANELDVLEGCNRDLDFFINKKRELAKEKYS